MMNEQISEIVSLIKSYKNAHNAIEKTRIGRLLKDHLIDLNKQLEEHNSLASSKELDIIITYWQYSRAAAGIERLKLNEKLSLLLAEMKESGAHE